MIETPSTRCFRRSARHKFSLLPLIAVLSVAIGCGDSKFEIAPASGQVLLDGKPLQGAKLTFMPMTIREDSEAGPYSNGETDAEGRFTLVTAEERERRGAVVGTHRVIVSTKKSHLDPKDRDREIVDSPEILPRAYYDYRQTTLEVEIPVDGTDTIELALDSKAGR